MPGVWKTDTDGNLNDNALVERSEASEERSEKERAIESGGGRNESFPMMTSAMFTVDEYRDRNLVALLLLLFVCLFSLFISVLLSPAPMNPWKPTNPHEKHGFRQAWHRVIGGVRRLKL